MGFIKHNWLAVAVVLGLSATPCAAATIDIISGSLVMPSPFAGSFNLIGDERGFAFSGGVDLAGADLFPFCSPCSAGSTVGIDISQSFTDLQGTVSLDGATHDVGFDVNGPMAGVTFSGLGVVLPALGSSPIVLTSPFAVSGFFRQSLSPLLITNFAGNGVASFTFVPFVAGVASVPAWQLQSAEYTVAPIPEPATAVLLITGLTGVVVRSRRVLRRVK